MNSIQNHLYNIRDRTRSFHYLVHLESNQDSPSRSEPTHVVLQNIIAGDAGHVVSSDQLAFNTQIEYSVAAS